MFEIAIRMGILESWNDGIMGLKELLTIRFFLSAIHHIPYVSFRVFILS